MRVLTLCLLLLAFCVARVCSVEVEPTANDWGALQNSLQSTQRNLQPYLKSIADQLAVMKKNSTTTASIPQWDTASLPKLEEQQAIFLQLQTSVNLLATELKGMPAVGRTREKFLALRRKVKGVSYQFSTDERKFYQIIYGVDDAASPSYFSRPIDPADRIPAAPRPQGLHFDWQTFPRIDGSTTAQPLSTLIACRFLGMGAVWSMRSLNDIRNARNVEDYSERVLMPVCAEQSVGSDVLLSARGGDPMTVGLGVNMVHTGTIQAYQNLVNGVSNFLIVSSKPSPDQLALAKKANVEFELRPIGYDAFIFLLNGQNPVNSLTVKQIQDIYQDNLLRWSEVGGADENIIAYQRERNSGSQETMERVVMKGLTMTPPENQIIVYGMTGPYNLLFGTPNGIGYTFYYYHTYQSPENERLRILGRQPERKSVAGQQVANPAPAPPELKIIAVNGVLPTPATIRDHSYPYVTEIYAVIRKGMPADSAAVRLRDWLLTPEGQAVVKESGYVPL